MRIVADLQIHSKYSRAVSQQMILPEIAKWAKLKGIGLIATGDWTHPLWFREISSQLVERTPGLFSLQDQPQPLFLLSGEISSIYSFKGKLRRIHNLIFAPSFKTVAKINQALTKKGANLLSDGRPIVGLTSQEIAEIVLAIDPNCLIIPAHAWTPWFSLYGSKSGFDSLEECFGQFSSYIYAIETGLSSDPAMNWRIKELDNRAIISCSDAHSPAKLGREATVFETQNKQFSYQDLVEAIKQDPTGKAKIALTIEFYPEEGKYHYTGHRLCGVRQSPQETLKLGSLCPVCSKPLTVGVMHRVEQLAGRSQADLKIQQDGMYVKSAAFPNRPGYVMIVPLLEIIAEALQTTPASQQVFNYYFKLCQTFQGEFTVLLKTPIEEIAKTATSQIAQGIKLVRQGKVTIEPGFDGVFGKVKIWSNQTEDKKENLLQEKQLGLFS